jgi:hypothetical protein
MIRIISSLEEIQFPSLNAKCIARIDTGALYNVIHCNLIIQYKKFLTFNPLDGKQSFKTKFWKKVKIMSSNGIEEDRYIIQLETNLGSSSGYATTCLTNRSNMQYRALIGRKFLADNNLLVSSK